MANYIRYTVIRVRLFVESKRTNLYQYRRTRFALVSFEFSFLSIFLEFRWMKDCMDRHPLFERIPDEDLKDDIMFKLGFLLILLVVKTYTMLQ